MSRRPRLPAVLGDSVIVAIDLQNDFCAPTGAAVRYAESQHDIERAVRHCEALVAFARRAHVPCVFVRSHMDGKYKLPKLLDRHEKLGLDHEICREGTWGADFYSLRPTSSECTVIKHTNDAFLYTYLEPLLRKHRARTVVALGVYTELCVEDTVRSALQRGFHVVVPYECTAGLSSVCAKASLEAMSAFQVDVLPVRELMTEAIADEPMIELPADLPLAN